MLDMITNLEVAIPMEQIIALLIITGFLFLLGNFKSALLANFIFIFYWIYQNNKSLAKNYAGIDLLTMAGSYTLVITLILFGVGLLIFYELVE